MEDLHFSAVAEGGDDGEVGGADHEVLVDDRVVDAHRFLLLLGVLIVVAQGVGEPSSEREVACGVLIEEGVVEQKAELVDGGRIGHQRDLAEVCRALVHADDGAEQFLVLCRLDLDDLAALEANREVLDELTVIGQGLGGVNDALGASAHGADEHFLGGDIRLKGLALALRILAAAAEQTLGDHADREIGAVFRGVMQAVDAEAVEVVAAALEIDIVQSPRLDGIVAVRAGRVQDRLPQLFDRGGGAQIGEQLLCPLFAGDSGDAPLVFVFHLIAQGLDDLGAVLRALGVFFKIHARESVGILADEPDARGENVDVMLIALDFPVLDGGERGQAAVADMQLFERLMVEFDNDLFCARLVAGIDDVFDKFRLIELGDDDDGVTLLHIDARACNQLRVFL